MQFTDALRASGYGTQCAAAESGDRESTYSSRFYEHYWSLRLKVRSTALKS